MFDGGCAICDAKAMKFNLSQAETFFIFIKNSNIGLAIDDAL